MEAVKAAIVYKDDVPLLELAAQEWIFPIKTPDDQWKLYFHMKPYRAYTVKKFFDLFLLRTEDRGNSEHILKFPNFTPVEKFFDEHFISMGGVETPEHKEPTIEQQKAWLDANPEMKVRVFREGYDAISSVEPEGPPPNGHKPVLIFDCFEHKIECEWTLYSEQLQQDEKLKFTHTLDKLTHADKQLYLSAIRPIRNSRKGERYIETNWDVIEQLYDRKIREVQGLFFEGEPCTLEKKNFWKESLPFSMKVHVIGRIINEIEIKNG
jgi:hypothetical protein